MDRLYEQLDAYNALPLAERDVFEAGLWSRFGQRKTVLILDMSGFSESV